MEQEREVRYYKTFSDDFVESRKQEFRIPATYEWIHTNLCYRVLAKLVYAVGLEFAFFYSRFFLHVKVENKQVLAQCKKKGFFLYGNHTQPVGDAFTPARIVFPRHIYTLAGSANLGIPVLGRVLPMLGALILPESMEGMRKLEEAIDVRLKEGGCIIVYPEAHVWPWYTKIRPFPATSFGFPVTFQAPSYCMTTTYQKRKYGKKPAITIYLDGPFYTDSTLSRKEQKLKLKDEIYHCMMCRSQQSTYEYIHYEREKPTQ